MECTRTQPQNHTKYALFGLKNLLFTTTLVLRAIYLTEVGVKVEFFDIQILSAVRMLMLELLANMPVNGLELMANALFGYGQLYRPNRHVHTLCIAPGYGANVNAGATVEYLRTMLAMESPETTGGINSSHAFARFNL